MLHSEIQLNTIQLMTLTNDDYDDDVQISLYAVSSAANVIKMTNSDNVWANEERQMDDGVTHKTTQDDHDVAAAARRTAAANYRSAR